MTKALGFLLCVAALFSVPGVGHACTIPVYRYALERWDLAIYDVLIYHRGPLSADVLTQLEQRRRTGTGNFAITTVDLEEKMKPELREIWKRQGEPKQLPRLVVRLQ